MERLLIRERIILDTKNISKHIKDKRILVTGAAGSIGRELVRHILSYDPASLCLVDQSELGMFNLMSELGKQDHIQYELMDITNKETLERLISQIKPQIIFHTAAYKHVPLLESQPHAAVENNTFATHALADLSVVYGVEQFIFISTDKAVNPENVMGITKRLSELYLQRINEEQSVTRFIITRFGNVMGSTGSVCFTFVEQILDGGPVTVTHPQVSRYLITRYEASQLVLEAAAVGLGGEIFLFDMGKRVSILDLANRMIKRYAMGKNIEIKFTGLREGEKLHEELVYKDEEVFTTSQPKLRIAKQKPGLQFNIRDKIGALKNAMKDKNKDQLLLILKNLLKDDNEKAEIVTDVISSVSTTH
ncbi:SDR family NAD(P)-dependent oxidoreductase [Dyadobacter psychrotolerans]|uniref:SDR family NAD(P)-dependent oxidoreductase n=1 Tax=Dyadobacter psychrotolerans TaxID=2541721 RepID=A0A4R5DDW1_9BACT|nr:SDR family NAD(P)-dependent oxidoreductase [Dyadobacter psychrotolerans]TDE10041.1 SDR family NAD(P)-dependent oxidoreductase [Dyadobacter psychrotolerans]